MRKATICIILGSSTLFLTLNWIWMASQIRKKRDVAMLAVNALEPTKHVFLHQNYLIEKNIFQVTKSTQNRQTNKLWNSSALNQALLYGKNQSNRYLTISIPTVLRQKGNYLEDTLRSLINGSDSHEKSNTTVLVLFADSDSEIRRQRARNVAENFRSHIESGFLCLIQIVPELYPKIDVIRRTFNDSEERIKWRAKQVLDFAFLFSYASSVSEYLLILEDDVVASPHYITAVKDFVSLQQKEWVSLTFTGFLIIGRLLKSKDLDRLAKFLKLFHMEKPVDLLILQFVDLLVPSYKQVTRRIPGLFQHIGLHSSLPGKVQKAKDKSFVESSRKFDVRNPQADIVTTLGVYKANYPESCYSSASGFFWGKAPSKGDTFDVIFHHPISVKRIFIDSGLKSHPNDVIKHAELKVSSQFVKMLSNKKADCLNFTVVSSFSKGKVDVFSNEAAQLVAVHCMRIEFTRKQSSWVIINEIAVVT